MTLEDKLCIVIDGTDRVGKSTVIKEVCDDLTTMGYAVVVMSHNSDLQLKAAKQPFNDYYQTVDNSLVYDVIGSSQLTTMTTAMYHISKSHEKVAFIFDRLWISSYVNGNVLRKESFKRTWNSATNYISYASAFIKSLESMGIRYENFVFTSAATEFTYDDTNELIVISAEDMFELNKTYASVSALCAKHDLNVHHVEVPVESYADIKHVRETLGYAKPKKIVKTKTILQPKMLLSTDRFDVFIKLAFIESYVKHRANGYSFESFKESPEYIAYVDHIRVFNGFNEPGNAEKNSEKRFVDDFIKIIEDVKDDKFDWSRSPIPVELKTSKLCNGSHRFAAACYWNKPIIIIDAVGRGVDGVRHVHYNGILAGCTNDTKHIGFITMNKYSYGRNQ